MTFLDNLEYICKARGESVCHALEGAGLNKSLYTKWKHKTNKMPSSQTMLKLAKYFGCKVSDLDPNYDKPNVSELVSTITAAVNALPERDQEKLLAYILFTYQEELPDEMQKLRKRNT